MNSLLSYREQSRKLRGRRREIWLYMCAQQRRMTDRTIRDALFGAYADMNMVRPRITELIRDGWIEECGTVTDSATAATVRLVRGKSVEERELESAAEPRQGDLFRSGFGGVR